MKKVLIVEDNDLNLKLFSDLLSCRDYSVIISKDGVNIPHIVTTKLPDLILMDIQLRGISGIDIIKQLKNSPLTARVPIIAVTAFAMKNDEERILEAGCEAYISKPFLIDELFKTIKKFTDPIKETIV